MIVKTRKTLFYLSMAVFFVLSALILALALGFSYDFKNNSFVKTGSIVLAANIQADVFINEKLEGRLSLLGNSFSEKGLLPGKYKVKIQKDGFTAWQKEVEVSEGLISSFGNIFLAAKDFEEKTLDSLEPLEKYKKKIEKSKLEKPEMPMSIQLPVSEKVIGFEISSDGASMVMVTKHEVWIYWLKDSNRQPMKKAGEKELITRLSGNIKSVSWHKNGAYTFLRLDNKFLMVETDTRGGTNIYTVFENLDAKGIAWYDSDSDKIFKYQNNGLIAVEL